jgi:hypothetical protein
MGLSSNNDFREMMKTLASNINDLATKCHVFSTGNKVKHSQLREANGASCFKCREIRGTNEWKVALPSIESKREC